MKKVKWIKSIIAILIKFNIFWHSYLPFNALFLSDNLLITLFGVGILMITIINYKIGNLGSIMNMLKKINVKVAISSSSKDIKSSDKLILPGIGSFDKAMSNLKKLGIIEALNEAVLDNGTPILGICVGM